jgi:hypothetical protein
MRQAPTIDVQVIMIRYLKVLISTHFVESAVWDIDILGMRKRHDRGLLKRCSKGAIFAGAACQVQLRPFPVGAYYLLRLTSITYVSTAAYVCIDIPLAS